MDFFPPIIFPDFYFSFCIMWPQEGACKVKKKINDEQTMPKEKLLKK